jgi:hypothetical protein
LSKPVYFPEWFDTIETNGQKWSDYKDDKDDLSNIPESWISPSRTVKLEPLSPILPDSISLSELLEGMFNTTRAKIVEPVLDGHMTGVTHIPMDAPMGQMSLSDGKMESRKRSHRKRKASKKL